MPFWLCNVIGSGADAEGRQFRPVVADVTAHEWTVLAQGFGRMLVRTPHVVSFDGMAEVQPLRRRQLEQLGVPLAGEPDDWESPQLALTLARRMLFRGQPDADPLLFRRQIDRVRARVLPGVMRKGGTFTDNFNGNLSASAVELSAWDPSGGLAWTVLGTATGTAGVGGPSVSGATVEAVYSFTSNGDGVAYACDDQLSPNQYAQAAMTGDAISSMVCCNRITDRANYIAIRPSGAPVKLAMWKRVAGAFTQLGSTGATTITAGAVCRLESEGDAHEAFVGGLSEIGPVNDAHNNTATRQGLNARVASGQRLFDDFEAGTLAAVVGGITPLVAAVRRQRSTLVRM